MRHWLEELAEEIDNRRALEAEEAKRCTERTLATLEYYNNLEVKRPLNAADFQNIQLGLNGPRKGNKMNDIALDTIDRDLELPVDATPVAAPEAETGETGTVFVQDEAFSEDEVR